MEARTHVVVALGFPFFKKAVIGYTGETARDKPVWEIQGWFEGRLGDEVCRDTIDEIPGWSLGLVKDSIQRLHPDKVIRTHYF